VADASPGGFDGSLCGLSQQCFELGEDLLDWVEVGRVWGQEEELGAGRADGTADRLSLVAAEIIHDDDIAGLERRDEQLFNIGKEALTIDRPIDDAGSVEPIAPQGRQEG